MKVKKDAKFKTITIRGDVYEKFDKLRILEQDTMGLVELSWSNFLAIIAQRLGKQEVRRREDM